LGTIIKSNHVLAHLSGADEGSEIDSYPLFRAAEIFVERAPIDRQVESTVEVLLLFDESIVNRRYRFAFAVTSVVTPIITFSSRAVYQR
jgi:hypothetical protein